MTVREGAVGGGVVPPLRILMAQCAPQVGDFSGNLRLAARAVRQAETEGCALVVLPELFVTGYPPEDLLLRRDFLAAAAAARDALVASSGEVAVLFGHPEQAAGGLFNSATLAWRGRAVAGWRKRALPNYGVFDERRYFTAAAEEQPLVLWRDLRLQVAICEDIWDDDVAERMAAHPSDVLIVLNASPFEVGKQQKREALLVRRSRQLGAVLCYVNAVGGQDELVFDGGSCLHAADGRLLARAPMFTEALQAVEMDRSGHIAGIPSAPAQLYHALTTGLRDYLHRNGCREAVLGLSGGIDSAVCAAIACDALGAEHVLGVLLPSRYSSDHSITDARALADNLGMPHVVLSIEEPVMAVERALQPLWRQWRCGEPDVTEENIQARMRGLLLMAIANKTGRMLLSTSNKSESAVGYTTLYGDMAGGFAPLKDLYKGEVYALADYLNRDGERIPTSTIRKPPSAELRPGQRDADSLPEYSQLDGILERMIEHDEGVATVASAGFAREDSEQAARLLRISEHKRRQAPPGIKVTARAFGRDRRYPITHAWHGERTESEEEQQ